MTYLFDPAMYAGLPLDTVRRQLGDQIERMIEYLDNLDGDPDLEPSYGYNPYGLDELEGDDPDLEPSLGWTAAGAHGNNSDLEENGDEIDHSGSIWLAEDTELVWCPEGGAEIGANLVARALRLRGRLPALAEVAA